MTSSKGCMALSERLIRRSAWLGAASLVLGTVSGCGDIRKTMGLESGPPREFDVSSYQKRLEVPRDFELLPPRKGNASQEAPFSEKGDRGNIPSSKASKLTPAEKNLLEKLDQGLDAQDQYKKDVQGAEGKKEGLLEGFW